MGWLLLVMSGHVTVVFMRVTLSQLSFRRLVDITAMMCDAADGLELRSLT